MRLTAADWWHFSTNLESEIMTATFRTLRKYGAKAVAGASGLAISGMAMAQATDPISDMLDAVSLGGISAKVVAAGLLIVGIALAFKAPDLAKRVVRKI